MGFTGAETKHQIYQDLVNYGVGDTYLAEERLIAKTSTLWIAAYLELYDLDNYFYKVVVKSSPDGTTWTDMVFPHTAGINYGYVNLAIGTDDSIHVVVNDANDMDEISYSVYSSGAWTALDIISSAGNMDFSTYLVLDSNNKPHIANSMFAGGVKYCNKISGSWTAWETVVATYKMMQMDISPNNVLHFALYNASNHVWYTSGVAGSFAAPEEVDGVNGANYMDITCNGEIPVIAATGNAYVRIYIKDGTWSNDDIAHDSSSNRVSIASADGYLYVAFEISPTTGFDNNQWFYTDNSGGSWSAVVNITNDDTVAWSSSTLWTDGTNFGFYSSGNSSDVACWLISAAPAPSEDKWGTLKLNLYEYNRNDIEQFGEENSLIPYVGVTTAQSRPLMSGRGRERREVSGWAEKTDFDSIEVDYEAFTKKKVEFHDGTQITLAIIEQLTGDRKKGSTRVWYKAIFLEVTL
jgi:hypothetical protein